MSEVKRVRFEIERSEHSFVVVDQNTALRVCVVDRRYYDDDQATRIIGDYIVRAVGGTP